MSGVREPAAAGRFYPSNPDELRKTIRSLLRPTNAGESPPKGIIAPHAGYVYSGPIAGSAHSMLQSLRGKIRRVILLGPAHYVRLTGLALPSTDAFQTPLGRVPIDRAAVDRALELPFVVVNDAAHAREHSLEVHLPFLQEVLGDFQLVPFAVGEATTEDVFAVIDLLWGGPETLLVVSSDLSHFHDYETAMRIDAETSQLIESLRVEDLSGQRCCGFRPIGGLLQAARTRGLRVRKIDLRNSGDTTGPRDRVVGYGAFVLEPEEPSLSTEERQTLLDVAANSIDRALLQGQEVTVDPADYSDRLRVPQASFVTLHIADRLRGCMGSLDVTAPLVADIAHNAYSAAFLDPRFDRLKREEFPRLEIQLSLLSPPQDLSFTSEADLLSQIRPGVDGLTLTAGHCRGTLLPSVWKMIREPREFLEHLKRKAGLGPHAWSPSIRVARYTAESIGRDL